MTAATRAAIKMTAATRAAMKMPKQ
jgi:hypothetical protein